ncbi:signal transduction histidine kinase [Microbacterium sp. AG790]|nr:signal transduction histidine kinase [Microbacterium sp. AG790]
MALVVGSLIIGSLLYISEESWRSGAPWQYIAVSLGAVLSAFLLIFVERTWARVLLIIMTAISPVAVPALWVALFVRGSDRGSARLFWTVCAAWAAGAVQTALYSTRIDGAVIGGVTARQFLFLGLSFTLAAILGAALGELRARQRRIDDLVAQVQMKQRDEAVATRQRERLQLGRDLHDTLGADTTVLNLYSRALLGEGPLTAQERAVAVTHLAEAAQAMSAELRHTINRLVAGSESNTDIIDPAVLLTTYRDAFAHLGSTLHARWPPLPAAVTEEVQQVCGLFAREALTNALKYAAPGDVYLRIEASDEGGVSGSVTSPMPSLVADDVRRQIDSTSVGLRSLQARADSVGGQVHAGPDGATYVVTLSVPPLQH